MLTFWQKNKVFIMGMLSAMAIALIEFTQAAVTDWLVVGYAAFVAIGSYLVRNLRGQWVTIIGVILTSAATIYTSISTGQKLNVGQFLLTVVINFILAVAPPPKPVGYEQTATISNAVEKGKDITNKTMVLLLILAAIIIHASSPHLHSL